MSYNKKRIILSAFILLSIGGRTLIAASDYDILPSSQKEFNLKIAPEPGPFFMEIMRSRLGYQLLAFLGAGSQTSLASSDGPGDDPCSNGIWDIFEEGLDCGGICPPCDSCFDNIQNGDEEGIDCGGSFCEPCITCYDNIQNGDEEGVDCGGTLCPPCATCNDNIQNGQETGVDCGGPDCDPCATCFDGVKNGQETGIDCGGPNCPACPTCTDNIKNGSETGVDCGGPNCPPCSTCNDNIQNGAETGVDCGGPDCPACPTCDDNIQNGDETGVDCGGPDCEPCATCDDNILNGEETEVDCGGPDCPACPTCEDNIQNGEETGVDCGGPECPVCPTCDDGEQNGDETGIDCGGSACEPCPTCEDNIQNGEETGVDCGGPDCPACPPPCNPPGELFTSDIDRGNVTFNWNAVEFAESYEVEVRLANGGSWYDFTSNETNVSIRGLSTGTRYEWRVRTLCEVLESDWSVSCFFTGGDANSDECNPPAPTCDDGEQNGDETGIDCGGSACEPCPTCEDNIQNGEETGVDCGGPDCLACPTCEDNIQNGEETGVDCGGPDCPACPTCEDNIQNGEETGVDCGGPDCPDCPIICDIPTGLYADDISRDWVVLRWTAATEALNYDVQIRLISGTVGNWYDFTTQTNSLSIRGLSSGSVYEWRVLSDCGTVASDWSVNCVFTGGDAGSSVCDPEPTCDDNIQNGEETGVDCGGPDCAACPTCDDNIQNGEETGVDCGGPDCGVCPTCDDGEQNGDETGIDCGGSACEPCPTCDDNIQNGEETGVDCGGPDCGLCPCNAPAQLYAENVERSRIELRWDPVVGAEKYNVRIRLITDSYIGSWYDFVTTDSGISIRGTSPGTRYEWQVQTVCSALESEWTQGCTFVGGDPENNDCPLVPTCTDGRQNGDETGVDCGGPDCEECPCDAPTELSAAGSVVFWDVVWLSWNAMPNATGYIVQVRRVGDLRWTTYEIWEQFGTSFTPDSEFAQPGVNYEWRVRSVCGENRAGVWSVTCTYVGFWAESSSACNGVPDEDYTCDDGIQNGYETDIDCGGPDCPACPTCDDNIQNGDEEGVDCGGTNCEACPPPCNPPYNLFADEFTRNSVRLNWNSSPGALSYQVVLSGIGYGFSLVTTTTDTTIQLGNGVPYLPVEWWVEAICAGGEYTRSVSCEFRRSTQYSAVCDPPAPTCNDGKQNGEETGVDCGGPDCGACPTCEDNIQNGEETGVDCGGPDCEACPTCDDQIQNGEETGLDCGGPDCAACPTCEDNIQNGEETGVDCGGPDCAACPTCDDNIQNGEETGVDCGGPDCPACPPPCDPPYNLFASDFTSSSFKLNWNSSPDARYYIVHMRGINSSFSRSFTTEDTTMSFGYEIPFVPIRWWVEVYCSNDRYSRSVDCEFERNSTFSSYCDPAPSCSDGIQNGDETGIDCGGSCKECIPDCYAPYNLKAAVGNFRRINLSWSGPPGALSYDVYYQYEGFARTFSSTRETSISIFNTYPTRLLRWWVVVNCYGGATLQSEVCTFYGDGRDNPACAPPSCEDGIQNGNETGIDCGGPNCTACPTCEDGIQNGEETEVDCGGPDCVPCLVCSAPTGLFTNNYNFDNGSKFGLVQMNWRAAPKAESYTLWLTVDGESTFTIISTTDTFYQREVRIDFRFRWWVETICTDGSKYKSSECTFLISAYDGGDCLPPTCDDNIQNGEETGVDCGGPDCEACPTCDDNIQNGEETGVDCGGPDCEACPTCDDNIQNGEETGVDCGGPDCEACPTCDDKIQNGEETGVDCGGPVCVACPTCDDGILNGEETEVDCGGPDCEECPPSCNAAYNLKTEMIRPTTYYFENLVRFSWEGTPNTKYYKLRITQPLVYVPPTDTTSQTEYFILWTNFAANSTYTYWIDSYCSDGGIISSVKCSFHGVDIQNSSGPICGAASCSDGIKNANETGIDCGGPDCEPCTGSLGGIRPSIPGGIQTWPNPARNVLNISLNFPDQTELTLHMRDIRGVEVRRIRLDGGVQVLREDIGDLPKGLYFLTVSNGRVMENVKVLVQ